MEAMAKKDVEAFCVIDHANKQADRKRTNPNRQKLRSLRDWRDVPEDSGDRRSPRREHGN